MDRLLNEIKRYVEGSKIASLHEKRNVYPALEKYATSVKQYESAMNKMNLCLSELLLCLHNIHEDSTEISDISKRAKEIINALDIDMYLVYSKRRDKNNALIRAFVWYVLNTKFGYTDTKIAKHFSMERTSVLSGCNRIEDLIDSRFTFVMDMVEKFNKNYKNETSINVS